MPTSSHTWRFFRAGGSDQVALETADDLRHLRLRLSAKAFVDLKRYEEALAVMATDRSAEGNSW